MPVQSHDSSRLIETACSSHGGLDAWSKVASFHGSFRALGGAIPFLKGLAATFDRPTTFSVYPHERRTVFHDYPSLDRETAFDGTTSPARMIVSAPRAPQSEQPNYRRRFQGIAKWRRWNPTDAAYFFGYALLTYFSVPFMLKDCEVLKVRRNAITVRLPPHLESHCQVQRFWFDPQGMITRHDYCADVLGKVFRGAHYSADFADVQGIKLARARRVVPRLGIVPFPFTVLSAALAFD
jgi:hypothetical protein